MDSDSKILYEFLRLQSKHDGFTSLSKGNLSYIIQGHLSLIDPDSGKLWDTYLLKLVVPSDYPNKIPVLYEMENKIPSDRHINFDKSCCLAPTVEQILILGKNYSLLSFVDKLVIPFLATQKLVELNQDWFNGEYSHGGAGLLEYYKKTLLLDNNLDILYCLNNMNSLNPSNGNTSCFCRSGKKYRNCHMTLLEPLMAIDQLIIFSDILLIAQYLKINPYNSVIPST